jgi:alpha-1,2-mannosyltransferase
MKLFALPGYAAGLWLWAAFGLVCFAALLWLPQRTILFARPTATAVYSLLLATALPILHNVVWGQVSILVTVLVVCTALLYRRHPFVAAAVLAAATSIKFYPALFAIYFLVRRDFKSLAVFAAAAIGWMAILPVLFLGVDGTAGYYGSLYAILGQLDRHSAASPYSGYIANAVSMLVQGSVQPESMLYDVSRMFGYLVVGASAVVLYLVEKRGLADGAFWAAALSFTMIPFVVGTCWAHYFVYLPLVQAFVLVHLLRHAQPTWSKLASFALLFASVALSNIVFFATFTRPDDFYRHGYLFWSNLLLVPALTLQALRVISPARLVAPS